MSLSLFTCILAVFVAPVLSQSCTGGRVFTNCGSQCPLTCENRDNPPICLTVCAQGCFCPSGTVLHNDQCIDPSECTAAVVPPTTEGSCTNGKVFSSCGTLCPLTCENRGNPEPCGLQCAPGCRCPNGLFELGDGCVDVSDCPFMNTTAPTTPPPSTTCTNGKIFETCGTACPRTCDNYEQEFLPCTRQCVAGCFCPGGLVEMGDRCVPTSECEATVVPPTTEGGCTNGKVFSSCGTLCPLTCENRGNPEPCGLQCAPGCRCPNDLFELGDGCVDVSDCPSKHCPDGMEYRECGPVCPYTCKTYFGTDPCFSLRCGSPGCFCPVDHVMVGGQCIHAALACRDPVPTIAVKPSPVVLKMKIRNAARGEFVNQQADFLNNIKDILSRRGYGETQPGIYSISEDEHLIVVIQLSGDSISSAQAEELANLLSEESGSFTLEIVEVTVNDEDDTEDKVLSDPVIIGIAVGASVIGLILVLLLSAILVMCVVNRRSKYKHNEYREKLGNVSAAPHDFTKDKLVWESLSY